MRVVGDVAPTLGPDVVVEAGAHVTDSVLMGRVVVRAGARVQFSVLDCDVEVAANAMVGEDRDDHERRLVSEELTLVGMGSRVGAGAIVSRGSRISPRTEVPDAR